LRVQNNIRQPFLDVRPEGVPFNVIAAPNAGYNNIFENDISAIPGGDQEEGF
jgi:hypothetical protein